MRSRSAALSILLMVLLAACGARLSESQRAAGIGVGPGGGDAGQGGAVGGGTGGPGATVAPTTGTAGGAGGAGAGGGSAAACGGGGATDKGVTANQITVATASDASGIQAALFKSTHEAMTAWGAMINSQGGICGRAIKNLILDTKADSTANNAAVREACDSAFALVGSMSAFDNGGAGPGEQCNIPDLTAITVNGARAQAKNVYPVYPIRPDKLAIGTANYIKRNHPTVIKKAAMLYLNAAVTKSNALQRVKGYESVGFDFIYVQDVQITEPSYGNFVQEMKRKDVQYVSMVANFQSIQKLLDAMEQADYYPKVRDWDSVAYSPNFVQRNNQPYAPADGSLVFLNTTISEEIGSNPEMQLYVQWLNRIRPGAKPDYFGFYAWSAGRLFETLAKQIGAKLTRAAVFDAVKKVDSWDGHGLHVAHNIGGKLMSPCFMYLEIKSSRFTRKHPASGFECNMGGIVNT